MSTDKAIVHAAIRWAEVYRLWHSGHNSKADYERLQSARNWLLKTTEGSL